ncbi:hypothetical protein ASE14_06440 [Agromyces sp. Root81]|uniref:AAA family ATPase n=1 Tax=Agromyces sp. Root81 TaxID=1736601 RepID=UPI0006FC0722|nr:AAA family ATPase [Agromyces sp. Root81]KRC60625.1 hypothetical protein ASE14_06440 [Agromyces sp. Root81]
MSDTRALRITPAAHIRSRRQKWLWTDRIPLGTVTIFAGRGGEGKSTFGLYVGAETIKGALPGDLYRMPAPFLIVSHEDDWATIMKPRLIGAGADPEHVYKVAVNVTVDQVTHETVPALPIDVDLIREAVVQTGAKLIMLDPITSTIGGDMHKVADVRRALDPLAALAQELEIAVLAIMHFNKGTGNVSDKLSGSHAFRDLSRSVLLFATDDETGQRVVSVDKSNYSAERGSSFAFNLTSVMVDTDDGESTAVARVDYLGDTDLNVSDIVNRGHDDEGEHDDRNAAQAFILDYLRDAEALEAKAGDVLKAGRAAGFNETELKNARKRSHDPKIASKKSGFGAGWVWAIDHEGVTEGVQGVKDSEPDTFDTFVTPSIAERLDLPLIEEVA